MLALIGAVASAALVFDVKDGSRPVTTLACGTKLKVTDSPSASGPAQVTFFRDHAALAFPAGSVSRTLYIYIDGRPYALFDGTGPIRVTVPLQTNGLHKIVTGSTVGSSAQTAWAVCKKRS